MSEIHEDAFRHLVDLANSGDSGALSVLVSEMIPIVRLQAAGFRGVAGVDADDLFQEGMIGILSAVRSYNQENGAAFKTYAAVCTRNRIITAVKKASGGKSVRPDNSVPFENETVAARELSPDEQVIVRDQCEALVQHINTMLSQKERSVLKLFLSGQSYDEIAKRLGSSSKSVDNALQRVRQKLKKYH